MVSVFQQQSGFTPTDVLDDGRVWRCGLATVLAGYHAGPRCRVDDGAGKNTEFAFAGTVTGTATRCFGCGMAQYLGAGRRLGGRFERGDSRCDRLRRPGHSAYFAAVWHHRSAPFIARLRIGRSDRPAAGGRAGADRVVLDRTADWRGDGYDWRTPIYLATGQGCLNQTGLKHH